VQAGHWADWDVAVGLVLAAALWASIALFPEAVGAWRVALGLVVLLAVPGHLLVTALFPGREDLEGVARAALALVLGAGLVILIALGLAEMRLRLTGGSASGGVLAVSAVCGALAVWRRHRLSPEARFAIPFPRAPGFWAVLALSVALAVLSAAVVGGALRQRAVAFFVTGPRGHLEGFPYEVAVGSSYRLGLHVSNPTSHPFVGDVAASANGHPPFLLRRLRLPPGGRWFAWVALPAGPATGPEVVRFDLYRPGSRQPYRALWVRYTVVR
jgi:uncharacterized membrane protein